VRPPLADRDCLQVWKVSAKILSPTLADPFVCTSRYSPKSSLFKTRQGAPSKRPHDADGSSRGACKPSKHSALFTACFPYSSTLRMGSVHCSEMSVNFHQTIRRHISENSRLTLPSHCRKNLKSNRNIHSVKMCKPA
jgi:hypothetical protein